MLSKSKPKPKPRVKFSPKCQLREFTPTDVTCLDSDSSDHTVDTEDVTKDDDTDDSSIQAQALPTQYYRVGDTLRSTKDMEQFTNLGDTIQSIYTLQLSEFAFVKRKSGDWTFCQLLEWEKNDRGEDVMIFSVNENGKERKSLRPMRWVKLVCKCSPHVRSEYFKSIMEAI